MVSPTLQFLQGQLFVTPKLPSTSEIQGRTFIITGANTGLGLNAAQNFHKLGATRLILACRSTAKGTAARDNILHSPRPASFNPTTIEVWELDMADYNSVKSFAARCAAEPGRIDAVILNAGIDVSRFELVQGDESTLAINVVSTFLLAMLLLEPMSVSAKKFGITPYISIVGSAVHLWADTKEINNANKIFDALNNEKTANMANQARYFLSKLLVLQCTRELAVLSTQKGKETRNPCVIINCVAPGWCKTDLFRHDDGGLAGRVALKMIGRTAEEGSRCLVSGVCAGAESHGMYLTECKVGDVSPFVMSARGMEMQKNLWAELMMKWKVIAPEAIAFK